MATKVIPLGNRILARQLPPPEKSAGGIWLLTDKNAHSVRFDIKRFVVLAPEQGVQDSETGEWRRTSKLEAGDIIRTGMYPGASFQDDDGEWLWFISLVGNSIICQEVE
jgi:co-chaperonin GroES (HSP10)